MNALTLNAPRLAPGWRWPGPSLLLYWLLVLGVYRESFASMVAIWDRSETYTHAYVVPPIVLWLIWRQRAALARLQPRPVPWLALPLAAVALLWWVADRVVVNAAEHFSLVAMLVAGVPLLLGWRITWQLLFPLAFSFFAVPFGDFLTPLLMQHTADFTVTALRLSGIPVYREGLQFVIPSGHWSVVEACSGIRYLMASFMVGTLFAYLNYRSPLRRWVFVGVSIVVPIIANWLRAYMIVMLGHLSGNTIATGVDHLVYGWVFFGVVITALFFIGARWAEPDEELALAGEGDAAASAMGRPAWQALALGLALAAVLWTQLLGSPVPPPASTRVEMPERLSGGWTQDDAALTDWRPVYAGATAQLHHAYRDAQGAIGVHLVYYRSQGADAKLISSTNVLALSDDPAWRVLQQQTRPLPDGSAWQSALLTGQRDAAGVARQRLLVRRLYWVADRTTPSEVRAKLWQAWQQLRGQADDGAAVMLSLPVDGDSNAALLQAEQRLDAFAAQQLPGLLQVLASWRSR